MNTCKKCGYGKMIGPRYATSEHGEGLVYQCAVCGYSLTVKCNDEVERICANKSRLHRFAHFFVSTRLNRR